MERKIYRPCIFFFCNTVTVSVANKRCLCIMESVENVNCDFIPYRSVYFNPSDIPMFQTKLRKCRFKERFATFGV